MSFDDNHWRAHMTPTARNVCTCAVFATSAFNFVLPTYFVLHYCYRRALYAVFYRRVFFKKSRAELFHCGVANDMSKVTHMLVCIVFTPYFCFASSVCFVCLRQRLLSVSFKKTTVHINLLEYFFLEIDVCVYPSLC